MDYCLDIQSRGVFIVCNSPKTTLKDGFPIPGVFPYTADPGSSINSILFNLISL